MGFMKAKPPKQTPEELALVRAQSAELSRTSDQLNEQRRRELTKVAAQYSESAKVAVRNVRRDGMDMIKKAKAAGMGEDDQKMWQEEVQEMTDKAIALIDRLLEAKQVEIMQV
jgi:ribosome recycling factor